MQWAIDPCGEKIEATKGVAAICPLCREPVIAKCGRIVVHHWAHRINECDPWYEPETDWHRSFKYLFASDEVEVTVGNHRADIHVNGLTIELQNSPISPDEIEERERHYHKMIWLVNAESWAEKIFLLRVKGDNLFRFRWKNMRKAWAFAKRPVFFMFGDVWVFELLGAEFLGLTGAHNSDGEPVPPKTKIIRYSGPYDEDAERCGYFWDPKLADLPPVLATRSVLYLTKLEPERGYGEARAVDVNTLLKKCGAKIDWFNPDSDPYDHYGKRRGV